MVKCRLDKGRYFLYSREVKTARKEGEPVQLSFNEQIAVIMKRQGVTVAELAQRLGKSRQNVNNRLKNSDFTTAEMRDYAAALGCTIEIEVKEPPEGGADKNK